MDSFSFHKESYFFELERRDKLNNSLTFPVGIVALLAGAISVMVKAISFPISNNQIVLITLLTLAGLCLSVSCYYLIRTYWGHPYMYMPYSNELREYRKNLYKFYIGSGSTAQVADEQAENDLLEYITDQYATDATFNAKANGEKSANLFNANKFIIACLVLLVLVVPSYLYQEVITPSTVYRVQLTSEIQKMANEKEQQPAKQPERDQSPAAPGKPAPPPSRLIKEDTNKPERK